MHEHLKEQTMVDISHFFYFPESKHTSYVIGTPSSAKQMLPSGTPNFEGVRQSETFLMAAVVK
jgi:hypothetical protein